MSQGIRSVLFLTLIVALVLLRQIGESFDLYHFQPYIALFFALAALRKWQWLAIPLAGYLVSTMLSKSGFQPWMLSILLAFALVAALGKCFSQKSSVPAFLGGSLGGAGIFYFVTNAASWLVNEAYAKTFAGFTQALWLGLPGYAPTWSFFRNDLIATVLFTAIILVLNRMTLGERSELVSAANTAEAA